MDFCRYNLFYITLIIERLNEIHPKYSTVFRELMRENPDRERISETLQIGRSQTFAVMARTREYAKGIYFDLVGMINDDGDLPEDLPDPGNP